jgi:beta-lactamase class A
VPLPRRDVTVRVTATTLGGRQSTASVSHVFGLPPSARPRGTIPHVDGALARRIVPLVRAFPGSSAVYVRDLTTGAGAAWNARAHFPAGSTLKLGIAVETLRSLRSKPARDSYVDRLLRRAIQSSDNIAANELEVLIGGSTSGGGHRVTALMHDLGLVDSEMYGGYIPGTLARRLPIPLRSDEQPYYGVGKRTSAYDMAQLFAYIHLAAGGKGRLAKRHAGFTRTDARYLLYLLAHVTDRGKLGRFLGGRASALHKAGWITTARHDAGIVYWTGGAFVVAVMTHGAGVGTASDVLAGRVARRALDRFSETHRSTASPQANPIPLENAKAGTTAWRGPDVQDGAIEAYASQTSVAPGETIRFHVSASPAEPYHIHVYRIGWYGGAGGREVACIPADCSQTSDGADHGTPATKRLRQRIVSVRQERR